MKVEETLENLQSMTVLKGKCEGNSPSWLLEDPIHYYFAFVFIKDRKKSLTWWVTSIRFVILFFW